MSSVLKKVEQIAAMSGTPCHYRDSWLAVTYDLGGGRDQTVYIDESGEAPNGMHIVQFFSPCRRFERTFLSGMSKRQAIDLLRRNSVLPFASFCIMSTEDADLLCVRTTQLLETMEVQEFNASCECVSLFADNYEREIGRDDF